MATYLWSSLTDGATLAFDPAVDTLQFDNAGIAAADVMVTPFSTTDTRFEFGGVRVVFSTPLASFSAANVAFADGSVLGTSGNLQGGAGNDQLIGGSGSDTVLFTGNAADYRIEADPGMSGSVRVVDLNLADGNDGSDRLRGIETLQFADRAYDLTSGQDVRVNTYTVESQYQPQITALKGGGYVATWISNGQDGDDYGIYGQRYDAAGAAAGGEFRINTQTAGFQTQQQVAALDGGGFVVTWQSGIQPGRSGLYGQLYDAAGTAVGGEFSVNAHVENEFQAQVTALEGGGFVATWASFGAGDISGVYGQRYDAAGAAAGSEFRINTYTTNTQEQPHVTALEGGGFVATWESTGQDGSGAGIYGQRYDVAGAAAGGEFRINTFTTSEQYQQQVTALEGGGFVATWISTGQDGSGNGVYAQRYDAAGAAAGSEFRLNTYTTNEQYQPQVTALEGGGFVGTWISTGQDGSGNGVYGQHYDAAGAATGGEFRVNSFTTNAQQYPQVAALEGGGFVATWMSLNQGGNGYRIYGQRYDVAGAAVGGEIRLDTSMGNGLFPHQVTALEGGGFVATWYAGDGSGLGVYGQRFDAGGELQGGLTLFGSPGHDILTAAGGSMPIAGGAGNDLYRVDASTQIILEQAASGFDTVETTAAAYTLPANVEALAFFGTGSFAGTGNALANQFTGGADRDIFAGLEGTDTVVLAGRYADYAIDREATWLRVTDLAPGSDGNDGSDLLRSIERLQFSDRGASVTTPGEFRINTYTPSYQQASQVAALEGGGFVATWQSTGQDGSGDGVYGQRYDALGAAAGGEFRINTYTTSEQYQPQVTALAGGGFVTTWQSSGQDGSGNGLYGQRYDAAGAAAGTEFRVNTYTASEQYQPQITALKDGGFVATWTSSGQDGSGDGIYGQRYDALGAAAGSEFRINTYTTSEQYQPQVTALEDGGFVATWTSSGQDGSGDGVYGQRYDAAGTAAGSEFRLNTHTTSFQSGSQVTALEGGGFVAAWASALQDGVDYGVYGQRYDAAGTAAGGEFRINTWTSNYQDQPQLTALEGGGFVATWNSTGQDGSGYGVYGQRYDAAGAAAGSEFRINTYTTNHQDDPQVTALEGGGFVATWTSNEQDENGTGVYGQRYDAAGAAAGGEFHLNTYAVNHQLEQQVAALEGGGFVVTWTSYIQDGDGATGVYGQRFDAQGNAVGTLVVTPDNAAPVAVADTGAVIEEGAIVAGTPAATGDVLLNDSDPNAGETFAVVGAQAGSVPGAVDGGLGIPLVGTYGSLTVGTDGAWTYALDNADVDTNALAQDAAASDVFSYSIADSFGAQSTSTLTIGVTGSNDAPVANGTLAAQDAITGAAFSFSVPDGTFTDVDSTLTYSASYDTNADAVFGDVAPDWITFDPATQTFSGNPQVADEGNLGAQVQASDGPASASLAFNIAVGANVITGTEGGETLDGTPGNDVIHALGGNDALNGLAGDDQLNGGTDSDRLDGGSGADTMSGGPGDDAYVVDNIADQVIEAPDEGTDIVASSVTHTLADNVEHLELTGTAPIDGTGNELANGIIGNAAVNTLSGEGGNDFLDGGGGNDTLAGGDGSDFLSGGTGADEMSGDAGDDIYLTDDAGDQVIEAADAGTDIVVTVVDETLQANVEHLVLLGSDNIDGTGNELANYIGGNEGDNTLSGLDGDDILDGTAGNDSLVGGNGIDVLIGGEGNDTLTGNGGIDLFMVNPGTTGADTVTDFQDGTDYIYLPDVVVDDPWITQNVSDQAAGARIQTGLDSTIDLVGVYSASISTADFV